MDIREVLALNLRKCRQAQRLSQEELAHRAEIDRTYISSIERRVYAASIDVVDRLARELGLEAADLLRKPARTARAVVATPSATDEGTGRRMVRSNKDGAKTSTKSRTRKIRAE
ncbi:helix-turn-helix domain-containing protein [Methylocystis rosea]|uniref:XRE family transcriptional regulator n=1 Tax=Methylocystis rosea TaxID=173366 RepID=A0A3G8M8S1_9HYPH|nr:XRE family transcriptional regulator [Methylocystis rosea]